MKKITHILLIACLAHGLSGQAQLLSQSALDSVRTFRSMERALKHDGPVYRLDLSGRKLKTVPEEVRGFKDLNALDLSGNRLRELPDWFGELEHMQELRISRNKLQTIPKTICKMRHLKRLDMSRNQIRGLPKCMGKLSELISLDLWSNDLAEFPDEIEGMKALRFFDLRAIQMEQPEMDRIEELLPKAKIFFSQPCNCGM